MRSPDAACIVCGGDVEPTPVLRSCDRLFPADDEFAVHECRACGLGMTRPRLVGDELSAFYPDSYPSWQSRGGALTWYPAAKGYTLAWLPPYSRVRGGRGRMLDVGLGRGDLAAAFARAGWHVCGLDMSAAAAKVASGRGIDARVGTLDDPPWPAGSFDLVVLSHVLEHVEDPVAALRQARLLLRPGGRAIVAVPGWDSWHRRAFRGRWGHVDVPRHLQHFTIPSLNRAAAAAGFASGRVRRCISMVGLPVSLQFAVFGRWPLGSRWRTGFLMAAVAAYPATWLLGRLVGGDCTYVELDTGPAPG